MPWEGPQGDAGLKVQARAQTLPASSGDGRGSVEAAVARVEPAIQSQNLAGRQPSQETPANFVPTRRVYPSNHEEEYRSQHGWSQRRNPEPAYG